MAWWLGNLLIGLDIAGLLGFLLFGVCFAGSLYCNVRKFLGASFHVICLALAVACLLAWQLRTVIGLMACCVVVFLLSGFCFKMCAGSLICRIFMDRSFWTLHDLTKARCLLNEVCSLFPFCAKVCRCGIEPYSVSSGCKATSEPTMARAPMTKW